MNKRERVYAALHNQETDYVPGCFWRHYTIPMKKGQDIVEAHMEFYRETDVDFIKISSDGYFGWPEPTVKNVQHAEELYKMGHITLDHPFISDQIERVRRILKEVNGECYTFYTLFCPLSIFRLQVGWDKMMQCMKEDPKAVMYACDIIADDVNAMIGAMIQEGLDGIFYSVQNAELTRFSLEEYEAWVKPGDLKMLNYMNSVSDTNILHCCGWDADEAGTVNHMESWRGYHACTVNWASSVDKIDVNGIKEFFPGSAAWGGFDNRKPALINTGTEEEVKAETHRLIRTYGRKGFLLGPDCSLPDDIDLKRIRWVMEATKSFDYSIFDKIE